MLLPKIIASVSPAKIFQMKNPVKSEVPTIEIPTGFLINDERMHVIIECSFPLKTHPDIEAFIEFSYTRGLSAELFSADPKEKDGIKNGIRKSYFVQLAVNTIPDSKNQKQLEDLVTWILTLFAFDNVIDNPNGKLPKDPKSLVKYTASISNVIKKNIAPEKVLEFLQKSTLDKEEIDLAMKAIKLAHQMQSHENIFLVEAKRYFDSSHAEMKHGNTMGMQFYISTRRESGAIDTVVTLAEITDPTIGIVPDYLNQNFAFQQLNQRIVDYIWAVNDCGGAKEWTGHEPSYLRIRTKEYMKTACSLIPAASLEEKGIFAFKAAVNDLLQLINETHDQYLHFKQEVLSSIEDGSIFQESQIDFDSAGTTERMVLIETAKTDFLKRCSIRENLASAGNECTRVSDRYYNPKNPEKNIEITQNIP